jgi:protein-L-isoaspartate(D-aspartate) O-methyltransferase
MDEDSPVFVQRRQALIAQIAAGGIRDARVLEAMGAVPRHLFVPGALVSQAYRDTSLPIGGGQTISQPSIVAVMTAALELSPTDRVLEIGTGSGYQTAILSRLAAKVFTIERLRSLAADAHKRLDALGCRNVVFRIADGSFGWQEHAPYQAILVAATAPEVPRPFVDQLDIGGRLVLPVGAGDVQDLLLVHRTAEGLTTRCLLPCRFVKLIGRHGHAVGNNG